MTNETNTTERVWDPLVRILHWVLVAGFFTAYLTEDDLLTQHVWAGYVVGAVVVLRVLWGVMGSQHARFTDFVYSPKTTVSYFIALMKGRAERHLGHSPAGGAMVIALLLSSAVTVYSGLVVYALEENAGPLAEVVANQALPSADFTIVAPAMADEKDHPRDGGEDDREDFWEELHEFFANFTLALVAFHIGGVLLASFVHKENLVKAMFTGRKRSDWA